MLRSQHNLGLLAPIDAGSRAAKVGPLAQPHLDKHQGAIALLHDQIDLTAASAWAAVVALDQLQALLLQEGAGQRLALFTAQFGASWALGCDNGLICHGLDASGHLFQHCFEKPHVTSSFTLALQAAHQAAATQHYPQAALYMVATPIGNLADISLRALHVLQLADAVACEDTRHTRQLLQAYGIDKPSSALIAAHQHNERAAAEQIVQRLAQGQRIAYVSDAGTPGISDPGAILAEVVGQAGYRILPLPGASSVTAALSATGLSGPNAHGYVFAGFLPAKGKVRQDAVAQLAAEPRAVVLLESPHRILDLAQALSVLQQRPITLAREITKQFEQIHTLPAEAAPTWLSEEPVRQKGEFVVIIHPQAAAEEQDSIPAEARQLLQLLLAESMPVKSAVRVAAAYTQVPRNALYDAALTLQQERDGDEVDGEVA